MQKNWFKLSAVAAVLAMTGAAQASVIHDDAFFDGTATNNGVRDYRSAGSFDVGFTADQARNAAISFNFFGSRSVDGNNDWQDNYVFALNGVTLFEGTFGLGGGGGDVVFSNAGGLTHTATSNAFFQGGNVVVSGMVGLVAGLNKFTFSFVPVGPGNNGGQSLDDEGWGVNRFDVDVAPVPLPAALPLLAGAVAGLGAIARRRKARAA